MLQNVSKALEVSTVPVLLEYRYSGTPKNARRALGFAGVCLGLCGECMHELWDRKLIYLSYHSHFAVRVDGSG